MPKKVNKNSFEKMCDKLEENYIFNENEVVYVRKYIKSNVKDDIDMLLKIKAEALEDDYWTFQSNKFALVALIFSAIGTIASLLPDGGNKNILFIAKLIYLLAIIFVTLKIFKPQQFKTVNKWRKYVLIVIDEMLYEQKNKCKKRKEKK